MLLSSPLVSPPTNLVADIKGPKMLNRVWASIFAMWFGDWGKELNETYLHFIFPKSDI